MNLSTQYLGFHLPHPFIAGASPLVDHLDKVKQLEDAGVAALVMHSLFEEQVQHHEAGVEAHIHAPEESFAEATSYFPTGQIDFHLGPEAYLEQIGKLKETVSCPVIASLNGTQEGTWIEYAKLMEEAGADALELNLYFQPSSAEETAGEVEQRCVNIVRAVRAATKFPVAVKLSPYFTSMPAFAKRMEDAGAHALVLFNRFLQPDIDIYELEMAPRLRLSTSVELNQRLRWIAMLYNRYRFDLAITGGVHTKEDAIKAIMSGADCVQLVSALLREGPGALRRLREEVETWLVENEYESLEQMKGSMSYEHTPNPEAIERANYLKILMSWKV